MKQVVQMAFERRLEAVVLGPGLPGQVRVTLGRAQQQFVADVPVELLDPSLRLPNSEFVAVVNGRVLSRLTCSLPTVHLGDCAVELNSCDEECQL